MNFRTLLSIIKKHNLSILAIIGGLIYAYQVSFYAITTLPNMDEGAFLLKGLAYVTGKYTYYQAYGFWNTKMFFSYYLWGVIQALFGAGIWAPRIITILLNLSTALAIWQIARKGSPSWLAPLALWIMALNTPFIKILSRANSQVVVNVLIVWIVYIFIKKNIRTPFVILGSLLVGALVLTRENMVFFVLPWVFYLWWDQGKKALIVGLLTFLTVVGVGHAIFFPDIMGLWLRFLPSNWVNDPVISLLSTPYNLDLQVPFFSKLVSLSYGIRHYYVQVFGFVVSLFYIKQRAGKTIDPHLFKVKIFLTSSFLTLLFPHIYASIGLEYCTFCFSTYMAFFINIAFILFILSCGEWTEGLSTLGNWCISLVFGLIYILLWFVSTKKMNLYIGSLPFPRIKDGALLADTTTIGKVLVNKFQISADTAEGFLLIVVAAILAFGVGYLVWLALGKYKIRNRFSLSLIFFAFILSYHAYSISDVLVGSRCIGNVSAWYSEIGSDIRTKLPVSPKIYIDGTTAALPLLYLPGSSYYPPQIDNYYSFVDRKDSAFLLKNGFWNVELKRNWLLSSSVLLIEPESLDSLSGQVDLSQYRSYRYQYTPNQCDPQVEYLLFVKKEG